MGEHTAAGENAPFLIKHSAEEGFGVEQAFHKHIRTAFAHKGHAFLRRILMAVGFDEMDMVSAIGTDSFGLTNGLAIAHEIGFGKAFAHCAHHGSGCAGIGTAND